MTRLSDYDFEYPEELVAARPAEPRDASRLMAVDRASGSWEHARFADLPRYLRAGDCLVLNETKVLRARLVGKKASGGRAEVLVVRETCGAWAALGSGLKTGMTLFFDGVEAKVEGLSDEGEYLLRFSSDVPSLLERAGQPPLPPYILKRRGKVSEPVDDERYQTVYAKDPGSIAAPTAGLHFTPAVFSALASKGVAVAKITLHVGRGTFRPITAENAADHKMLPEWYSISDAASKTIRAASRVITVGTTSTRALEASGGAPGQGSTDLFISPGYEFKVSRGLVTNFHLPRSTPLMLAASFLGREKLLAAYAEAFKERYRLYSYGDAMLIL
jgi:S-adenosylmethionine:tRNA ribosyltransferase-isomerase